MVWRRLLRQSKCPILSVTVENTTRFITNFIMRKSNHTHGIHCIFLCSYLRSFRITDTATAALSANVKTHTSSVAVSAYERSAWRTTFVTWFVCSIKPFHYLVLYYCIFIIVISVLQSLLLGPFAPIHNHNIAITYRHWTLIFITWWHPRQPFHDLTVVSPLGKQQLRVWVGRRWLLRHQVYLWGVGRDLPHVLWMSVMKTMFMGATAVQECICDDCI